MGRIVDRAPPTRTRIPSNTGEPMATIPASTREDAKPILKARRTHFRRGEDAARRQAAPLPEGGGHSESPSDGDRRPICRRDPAAPLCFVHVSDHLHAPSAAPGRRPRLPARREILPADLPGAFYNWSRPAVWRSSPAFRALERAADPLADARRDTPCVLKHCRIEPSESRHHRRHPLRQIFEEAGWLPARGCHVVTHSHPAGRPVVDEFMGYTRFAASSAFTGSTNTGRILAEKGARH